MLKTERLKKKLTQKQLAALTGLHQSYISKLERPDETHKSPTVRQVAIIAKTLGICPRSLSNWFLTFHMSCNCTVLESISCKSIILIHNS